MSLTKSEKSCERDE